MQQYGQGVGAEGTAGKLLSCTFKRICCIASEHLGRKKVDAWVRVRIRVRKLGLGLGGRKKADVCHGTNQGMAWHDSKHGHSSTAR